MAERSDLAVLAALIILVVMSPYWITVWIWQKITGRD